MFFQALIGIFLLAVFAFLVWHFIIAPILKANGIKVEEEKPVETDRTRKLAKLKKKYIQMVTDGKATDEIYLMEAEIKNLEKQIAKRDLETKEL